MRGRRAGKSHPWGKPHLWLRWLTIAALILGWEMVARWRWVDPLFIASVDQTVRAIPRSLALSLPHLQATLAEFGLAFALAIVLGVGLGLVIGIIRYLYQLFNPLLVLGVVIPKVTLLPLFILWLGIGKPAIIVYGMLSGFFPIVINTIAGVREVKPIYITAARSMGHSTLAIYGKVVIPSMLPVLSVGLFLGSVHSILGIFIMEMALARYGLGALISSLAVTFRTPELYAVIILTALLTLIINYSLWAWSKALDKWRG